MKNKKVIAIAVVLLLVVAVAYKMVLAPKPVPVKKKIEGAIVNLSPEFVLNLSEGRYAKVSVALLLDAAPPPAEAGKPALEQDAVIRSIITDDLTNMKAEVLIGAESRKKVLLKIKTDILKQTDVVARAVYFTDIAVQ